MNTYTRKFYNMDKENKQEVIESAESGNSLAISKSSLDASTSEIVNNAVKSNDPDEIKDLTQLFNQNMVKKNLLRVAQSNELLDLVIQEATDRFKRCPGAMSNKDVLDYMSAVQTQIDKAQKVVDGVNQQPLIQVNKQTNEVHLNINGNELSEESREKILDFMAMFKKRIDKANDDVIDVTVEEGDEHDGQ